MNGRRTKTKSNITRIQSQYVEEQKLLQEKLARRKRGIIRRLTAFSIVAAIFISFTVFTINNQKQIMEEQQATKARLEEELKSLQKEEKELLLEIENLHTT